MIKKAFEFALKAHGGQKRKDGKPYILHPVEVAVELAKNGASDELICAGFLHDTIEDTPTAEEELACLFPPRVVTLVVLDSENKSLSWEERKNHTIEMLRAPGCPRELKMLVCADKLSNIRSMRDASEIMGDELWCLFKRGKDKQRRFYEDVVTALSDLDGLPMYNELKETIKTVFYK